MHSSKHTHINTRYLTYVRYDTCAGCCSPGLINVLQTLITQPAPPDEEQFNAPATGGRAMKERIKIILNKERLTGHRGL